MWNYMHFRHPTDERLRQLDIYGSLLLNPIYTRQKVGTVNFWHRAGHF